MDGGATALVVVGATAVVLLGVGCWVRGKLMGALADRATGEQRRKLMPPGSRAGRELAESVCPVPVDDSQLEVTRAYYPLQQATLQGDDGKQLFYSVVMPKSGAVESVIVFFHGFGDHHDFLLMNVMRIYSQRFQAAVFAPDMPGHGRSDGTWVHVPDWFEFVDAGAEFVERVARPRCTELAPDGAPPLKLFIQGVSMGGGVCATLALTHPDLMDGMILEAPMLTVSDDIKPPWLVQMLFKHCIVRMCPLWPAAPTKDILDRCWTDPKILEVVRANRKKQGLGYAFKPRLRTAMSLGFQCTDWLGPRLRNVNVPFFVMHGAADEVTDPASSRQLFDQAITTDKTLRIVPGARHGDCLMQEAMYDQVGAWIGQRVGSTKPYALKVPPPAGAHVPPEADPAASETTALVA
eukprot:COSAG01_NODE_1638_length_9653_cov_230.802282_11_plen_408_part_00